MNLATHLLLDAFDDEFDAAIVVSNDSDLAEPMRVVQSRFGLPVGVAFPVLNRHRGGGRRPPSNTLREVATFVRFITGSSKNRRMLARRQFPETLTDSRGSFARPPEWA